MDRGNVTGYGQEVTHVLRPGSREQIQQIVREANQQGQRVYPISTGLNWGYGSATTAASGCTVLDLSGMNRILNADQISSANPVAVIEPGVTQRQLYEFLRDRCPDLMFNVTGSAADTSILGNALDRGVGYLGPRREDLFGLEVVTGLGEVLQTGFRRLGETSPLAHSHPYGLGPILDGLFFQGNFGIVTSACFKLVPRAERQVAVSLALKREANLGAFIDVLAQLKREGVMGAVTHIGNKARTHASLMYGISRYLSEHCGVSTAELAREASKALASVAPFEWTSLGGISGTARLVRAAVSEVKARVGDLARLTVVDDAKLDMGFRVMHGLRFLPLARANAAAIAAIRPLHGLASGVPSDVAIDNLLWRFGRTDLPATSLDESSCGLLFISPALPMDGVFVADVVAEMTAIAARHQNKLYVTVNIETSTSLVAVTNLLFDRSSTAETVQAQRCADALLAYIRSRGLEVYRARTDMMGSVVDEGSDYWQVVRRLKAAIDPGNIISPGRYNLAT